MDDGTPGDLVALLAQACERYMREVFAALASAGHPELTSTQAFVLRLLGHGPSRVTELAATVGTTSQAMSKVVAELERLGLLARSDDDADARVKRIALTADGAVVAEAMAAAERATTEHWAELVGPADLDTARRALAALVRAGAVPPPAAPRRLRFA